MKHQIKWKK